MRRYSQQILEFIKGADTYLFVLCLITSLLGIALVASATATYGDSARYIAVQIGALMLGIFFFIAFTLIDIDIIVDRWPIVLSFSIVFMLTLLIWGYEEQSGHHGGWLRFGFIGIQPVEIVKFTFVVLLAKQIDYLKRYKNLNSLPSVMGLAMHLLLMFGLIIITADDLGSAMVFTFCFVVMLFIAGVKLHWFAIGIGGVAAVMPFLWTNFFKTHQKLRIMAPYDPSIDPTGTGVNWQLSRSKLALASGQFFGTGLFKGPQTQSDSLPAKHTDFIFAVAGEELGMIGCCLILLLLCLIIIRCISVGLKSNNTMNMLICFGIGAKMFFQVFENIGMCLGLTPVIGLTLPFISYGGSSMFSSFAAMGIVSGIKYRPKPERLWRS